MTLTFGEYEHITLDASQLVVLPQVRKIKNSKIDDLVDSIEDKGLINPIDVTRLTYDELSAHIAFINQLWKKDVKIESFNKIGNDYYVVIAGHSRLQAIKTIGERKNCNCLVTIKIHSAHTSEDILAIQLDENIHSEPRIEERAIAIIETYRLGMINGKWSNRNEFISKNQNKFSRRILSDAIDFSNSPVEIQEYVFANNISFTVGVELGRMYPLVEKYENDLIVGQEPVEQNIKLHYASLLMKLQKKSIKRSLEIIRGNIKMIDDHFREPEDLQQEMFAWFNSSPERQGNEYRKELIDAYNKAALALNTMPFEYFMNVLNLDTNLTGIDHADDLNGLKSLYAQYVKNRIFERKR
jgi:hypothetical protein